MRIRSFFIATLTIALFIVPTKAYANVGLPMIVVLFPLGLLSLPVIVVVEALVVARCLRLGFWQALKIQTLANVLSTVVGVPIVWCVLAAVEIFLGAGLSRLGWRFDTSGILVTIFTAPWLIPLRHTFPRWIVPTATLVLLGPFFFASYWTEFQVVNLICRTGSVEERRRAVWFANGLSYAGFAMASVMWLAWTLMQR
jgi:hypothetical protein